MITFEELSEDVQNVIIKADPDEKFVWYAKKNESDFELQRIEKNQTGLLEAAGGMDVGWLRVTYDRT